jgi:hypothetical protein
MLSSLIRHKDTTFSKNHPINKLFETEILWVLKQDVYLTKLFTFGLRYSCEVQKQIPALGPMFMSWSILATTTAYRY